MEPHSQSKIHGAAGNQQWEKENDPISTHGTNEVLGKFETQLIFVKIPMY